jgi:hypothetical protein
MGEVVGIQKAKAGQCPVYPSSVPLYIICRPKSRYQSSLTLIIVVVVTGIKESLAFVSISCVG